MRLAQWTSAALVTATGAAEAPFRVRNLVRAAFYGFPTSVSTTARGGQNSRIGADGAVPSPGDT
jgi:hypothetical protein